MDRRWRFVRFVVASMPMSRIGSLVLDDAPCLRRRVGRADDGVPARAQLRGQVEGNEDILLHNDNAMIAH